MRALFGNCGLKLLALVTAAGISAYVYNEIDYPVPDTMYLPLRARNLRQSLTLTDPLPQHVTVRVRGPYRSIRQLRGTGLVASVDLGHIAGPGTVSVQVNVPDMGDVVVTGQDYDALQVKVDNAVTKQLPLNVHRIGQLRENLGIGDEQWEQKAIQLTGPEELLSRVQLARIEPDLARLSEEIEALEKGVQLRLPIHLYDEEGQAVLADTVKVKPSEVDYFIKLVTTGSVRVLKVIPDYVNEPPEEYLLVSLTPRPLYVPVPASMVPEGVLAVRTEPIDLRNVKQSFVTEAKLIYPFTAPEGANLPDHCDVSVELLSLEVEGPSAARINVELVGERPEFEYVVTPPQLKVISDLLGSLDTESKDRIKARMAATLRVDGLRPGEHRLVPQISLPAELEQVRIIPNSLTLTIIERGD